MVGVTGLEPMTSTMFVYRCLLPMVFVSDWLIDHIGMHNGEKRLKRLSDDCADAILTDMINSKEPFAFVRYGHTEFCCMQKVGRQKYWRKLLGIHPNIYSQWENLYWQESKQIDILAVWNYRVSYLSKLRLVRKLPNVKYFFSLKFQTYPFGKRWLKVLEGKKVLVINPFVKSIKEQYKKRELIGIMPELQKLDIMEPVFVHYSIEEEFDWFGALEGMKEEVKSRDFDIALIGCGPYGLPLATYIKGLGKQAIHLGGATQLYFGIKGKRWVEDPLYKGKFTEHWIFPLEEDISPQMRKIENGCYIG